MANSDEDLSQFDISKEENDKLVGEVIRYILFKTNQSSGCPIKREELTQLVTKNYPNRLLPAFVINEAKEKLSTIFGYELRELQRSRPSTNQGRNSLQKNLWHQLKQMGLHEAGKNHAILGHVKQVVEALVQQRFLQKDKVAEPEGTTFVYELAERALDGQVSEKIKQYMSQIVRKDITVDE